MGGSWPWRLPALWNIAGMRTLGTTPLPDAVSNYLFGYAPADIEQPLTQRNLINLAHILPKQSKDVDLHLVETFNEVVNLTVYAHPDPMNPFEQLENPA